MKNYVQSDETIVVLAPYDVASGAGALVGSLFGVAVNAALSGAKVPLKTRGVYTLVKADSQAWTVGAKIYWDNTAKNCTTTATSNTLIGCATAAVASSAGLVTGTVRLNGTV